MTIVIDRPAVMPALRGAPARTAAPDLPRWPFTALFAGLPAWWLVGVVDVMWILIALPMALLLARSRDVRVPRGFGVYMLFLAWSAASVVMLAMGGSAVVFGYRLALYLSGGVLFVYLFNARARLGARYVAGCLTTWWAYTVAGGYLGLAFPNGRIRTPMSYVLPQSLRANDLVDHMVVRRLTEFNPSSYLHVAPRPSAPFLYTNNWGNAYSLLLPIVVAYLYLVRRERRAPWLLALLLLSLVPAFLTLNRGMLIGVALAAVCAVIRSLLLGRWRAVGGLAALALVAVVVYLQLPVTQRLDVRLDSQAAQSTSTDTRSSLYTQTLHLVPGSPVFGYGVPQASDDPDQPPVGTQGQVWMILVSHGPVAALCFVGWFLGAFVRTWRRRDPIGLACNIALLVGTVELFYYGVLPSGLPVMMVAAALGLRE